MKKGLIFLYVLAIKLFNTVNFCKIGFPICKNVSLFKFKQLVALENIVIQERITTQVSKANHGWN